MTFPPTALSSSALRQTVSLHLLEKAGLDDTAIVDYVCQIIVDPDLDVEERRVAVVDFLASCTNQPVRPFLAPAKLVSFHSTTILLGTFSV